MDNVNVFHLVVAPNWEKDLSKMATSNHSLELIENHRLNQTCGYLWIPQLPITSARLEKTQNVLKCSILEHFLNWKSITRHPKLVYTQAS
ncbi:hypothetical protein OUZ56_020558 [Daphnia magna]|uniref:Uncharacterized protein n=1 Tax=Daphnia magna TaxID=35525 RepID=A0ABQ9ZET0_9CRUS|nr:hypothetical protein OUZ56_020558 [Daphnia magna]